MNEARQTCFIDMPFGDKKDPYSGGTIHFDDVYERGIEPAVIEAGLECIRGDRERTGGVIHSAMFARLLLSDFVIADMTTANPNVFYELGVRHCARPRTTIPIFSGGTPIPFDVGPVRAIPYSLENGSLTEEGAAALKSALTQRIRDALERQAVPDSPLFEFVRGFPGIELSHEMTDVFRDKVKYAEEFKRQLVDARTGCTYAEGIERLKAVEASLEDLHAMEHGTLIDLFLSYRDLEAVSEMIALYDRFPPALKESVVARQQLAMALNRRAQPGDRKRARDTLKKIIDERGGDAETYGLLGRIDKDRFSDAKSKNDPLAEGHLDAAISSYTKGFEMDPLDYYPGVNAVNLLTQKGTPEALEKAASLVPVVTFAVVRRGGIESEDYWQVATVFELACLKGDLSLANKALLRAASLAPVGWMLRTTANNLDMLITALRNKGEATEQLESFRAILTQKAHELSEGGEY